ncbi:MAG: nucleotide exchange factor GrpE [Anaerolineae bacterium]
MSVSDQDGGFGAPPGAAPSPDGQRPDATGADIGEKAQLAKELAEAQAKATEYLDGWQRERAAFANYRKRAEQERAAVSQEACADVVCQLLPVLDDLARACDNIPAEIAGNTWANGVCMVLRKLEQTIERLGVEPISVEGATFDPSLHEALTHEEAPGFGEGDVIGEVTRGYRLGNRVLRCSLVRVAKGNRSADD